MSADDRRKYAMLRVPRWNREEVPDGAMALAERRTAHLQAAAFNSPISYLLACAYLQGINDSLEAHGRNPDAFALGFDPRKILRSESASVRDVSGGTK